MKASINKLGTRGALWELNSGRAKSLIKPMSTQCLPVTKINCFVPCCWQKVLGILLEAAADEESLVVIIFTPTHKRISKNSDGGVLQTSGGDNIGAPALATVIIISRVS